MKKKSDKNQEEKIIITKTIISESDTILKDIPIENLMVAYRLIAQRPIRKKKRQILRELNKVITEILKK